MGDVAIRPARGSDAQAIAAIYAWHVANGTATFDTVAPDAGVWAEKIADFAARGFPFLVAERDGGVAAYAYAARFRDRAAFDAHQARTRESAWFAATRGILRDFRIEEIGD